MMRFPVGEKKEQFKTGEFDLESYIFFLMEDGFTGVVEVEGKNTHGELLLIDGPPFCATWEEIAGNEAVKEILKAEGVVRVYFLEKERAAYTYHWYTDVKKAPLVSWRPTKKEALRKEDVERIKVMEELGISTPSKDEIKKILQKEDMDFLAND